ncbi:MAG: hypothetical protein RR788_01820 [Erysipelotrichaceae bacterium]
MDVNIEQLKTLVKQQLKGKYGKVVLLVFVTNIISLLLNLLGTQVNINNMVFGVLSFVTSLIMIVVNYIVQFVFLKIARGQKLDSDDIAFGFKRIFAIIGSALLITILSTFVLMIAAVFLGPIWIAYMIASYVIQLFFFMLQGVIAYAIYDGSIGVFDALKGAYKLIKRHYKAFLSVTLIYFLINIVLSLALNIYITTTFEGIKAVKNVDTALIYAFSHNFTSFLITIGFYCGTQLVSSLMVPFVYLAYANIYEQSNKEQFFTYNPKYQVNIK